jgi:hypothetical protein
MISAKWFAATALAALLSIVSVSSGRAQSITAGQFRTPKSEKDMTANRAYLIGAKDALLAYNNAAEDKLFCLPGVPQLSFDQASDIAMRWTRKKSINADDLPLALVLLYGLRQNYPCPH